MARDRAERIEKTIDRMAAACFAAAAAYAASVFADLHLVQSLAAGLGSGLIAYLFCSLLLSTVQARNPDFPDFQFALAELPVPEFDELLLTDMTELVLTDADRVKPLAKADADELVLDDILAQLGPDSRVVRLFDPGAMPTPGQLKSRIDRHLQGAASPSPSQDASHALHQALAELRRSLR